MGKWMEFWKEESAANVVEISLLIVAMLTLVLLFKNQLTSLVKTVFRQINNKAADIY